MRPPPESFWRWLFIWLSGVYTGIAISRLNVSGAWIFAMLMAMPLGVLALRCLVFGRRGVSG